MILLTIIALGLLSLSSVSLRAGGQGQATAMARANARLALQLAIGALQTETGPDQRVTATADQISDGTSGDKTAADAKRRNWTGVYRAWLDSETTRPEPTFRSWLVSGTASEIHTKDFAKSSTALGELVQLVGPGSVGSLPNTNGEVTAPLVTCKASGGLGSRYAWWVGDQGVKAAMATPASTATNDVASTRGTLQSAPRNATEVAATSDGNIPFENLAFDDPRLGLLTGWKQGELLASTPATPKPLFHDLAAHSVGLLTNVRSGGFRQDLSFYLEKPQADAPRKALYTVGGAGGINESELWLYYNLWKELKTGGSNAYTTGGSIGGNTPYLQVEAKRADMLKDPEQLYKQPTITSFQTMLSFYAHPVTVAGKVVNRLSVVMDPILTLWNPLDVPVVVTPAYNSIKFCQIPYNVTIKRPSGNMTVSLCSILGGSDGGWQYLTLLVGKTVPIVMKPGEVLMVSQGANTAITSYKAGLNFINAQAGWNFGGGIAFDVKTKDEKGVETYVDSATNETFTYEIKPNSITSYGSRDWILTGNGVYYKDASGAESFDVGGQSIDQIDGLPKTRLKATDRLDFFDKIKPGDTRPLTFQQINGRKEPFMRFSFAAKTETDSERPCRFLSRFNPKALTNDLQTLTPDELETLPFEVHIEALNDFRKIAVNAAGDSFFGGGTSAQTGNSTITTHSIPREPLNSLASFQDSCANGLTPLSSIANVHMLPQISHAIGNSMASPVIPKDQTSSSLEGPRPLADHSYLANQALWDAWFLSSVAPQTAPTYSSKREQVKVARDFLGQIKPLPNSRYLPALRGETADDVIGKLFSSAAANPNAHLLMASYLVADGMFNINSTSVEAWRTVLSGLKDKKVVTRNGTTGLESIQPAEGVPVQSLFAPENQIAKGADLDDVVNSAQWVGRRVMTDAEITELAKAVVKEVRKRGPFISLADFINRRPGSDKALARSGAIQSALDSKEVSINSAFNDGARSISVAGPGRGFAFPEAEDGASAYGIPGVVKQADILNPIAPYLSARSDTFLIRAYGDSLDANGKVVARAWCEAEIQRDATFVDPSDLPETATALLKPVNKTFGRHYRIVSFRWLNAGEV
ncbi:MAG: hypothetical protein ABIT37_09640 [Luteolibacter sp.]